MTRKGGLGLVGVIAFLGCSDLASPEVPKNLQITVRSHAEVCGYCTPRDRRIRPGDRELAFFALRQLLGGYLTGTEIAGCPDGGIERADGVILITEDAGICDRACRGQKVRVVPTLEAAEDLALKGYWRLIKLGLVGAVSVDNRDGILLECSTGHNGEIDTYATVLALVEGNQLVLAHTGTSIVFGPTMPAARHLVHTDLNR